MAATHQPLSMNENGTATAMQSVLGLVSTAKEKWTSSGASDAFSRASASIPDSTKQLVSNMFKREHLRGVSVFFGIGEERAFYVERTPSLLAERVRHNVAFFYLNYMLLTAVLFCLTLMTSPFAIFGMALLGLAWMWVIRASQSGALVVGTFSIPQKTATIGMAVISFFVLMYLLTNIFWWTLFSTGLLVAIHAFLRDASMHKDMDDVVTMQGDLNLGEDASFLNGSNAV